MLQKKIHKTVSLIDDVMANRDIKSQNENIARINKVFFDNLEDLKPLLASYIMVKRQFGFELPENVRVRLKSAMEYAKTAYDEKKAVSPDSFRKNVTQLCSEMPQEWEKFYKEKTAELIDGLTILIPVHSAPTVVRNCLNVLKKCEKFPLNQKMIDDYFSAEKQACELLDEMHFSDDIKAFLEKVSQKRATLEDLTPEILEWIRSEGIAGKIGLMIKVM